MKRTNSFGLYLLLSILPLLMLQADKAVAADDPDVNPMKAQILAPVDGSKFNPGPVTFERSETGQSSYLLTLGSSRDGNDVYSGVFSRSMLTVGKLPTDGRMIYVRLMTRINGAWYRNNYQYRAASYDDYKGSIINPAPDSRFSGSVVTFQKSQCPYPTHLSVGTAQGGGRSV